ncbi:helix-turn-helix domain-containing protein [Streptomyces sp. NPDC050418]|uniref:helix-turn-helix domain-containing protein n=1 Tax=Streptomyces sp. NPDC050418 TaxID=3365612 RepID=UPI00379B0896
MDFAQAAYERRAVLGWDVAELARRAGMTEAEIESIEESGVEPTLELIERLAAALESGARIDPGHTPEFRFEERAA